MDLGCLLLQGQLLTPKVRGQLLYVARSSPRCHRLVTRDGCTATLLAGACPLVCARYAHHRRGYV